MTTLAEKATPIRLLVLDVDGVLTDGLLFYDNDGHEYKNFHVQDGLGIQLLQKIGITVAVISGKSSLSAKKRLEDLGIQHIYFGQSNKIPSYENLKEILQLSENQIAYMGDDLPDLPLLTRAGFAITVPAASAIVKQYADYVTEKNGGHGAVREICDFLLQAQGSYQSVIESYL